MTCWINLQNIPILADGVIELESSNKDVIDDI